MQDRSIAKTCSNASDSRGSSDAVDETLYLHQAGGLDFCKQALSGPQTVLGPRNLAQIHSSGSAKSRDSEAIRMAYLQALVLDSTSSVGTEFKVMQELLRHSTLRSTLDVYTQAVTPAKHAAQAAVTSLVFSSDKSGAPLVAE